MGKARTYVSSLLPHPAIQRVNWWMLPGEMCLSHMLFAIRLSNTSVATTSTSAVGAARERLRNGRARRMLENCILRLGC